MTAIQGPRVGAGVGFLERHRRTCVALSLLLLVMVGAALGGAIGVALIELVRMLSASVSSGY